MASLDSFGQPAATDSISRQLVADDATCDGYFFVVSNHSINAVTADGR